MSAPREASRIDAEVSVSYGAVSFLFDARAFAGCAFFAPASVPARGNLFFAEPIRFGGESVPAFDLDGRLRSAFALDGGRDFPVALVLKLDGLDSKCLATLRASCESSGATWNGRLIACRLSREVSVVPRGSARAFSGIITRRSASLGFPEFLFAGDDAIGWRVDPFRLMVSSIELAARGGAAR